MPTCKAKVVATKQSSYPCVSVLDLSNLISATLSEDLAVATTSTRGDHLPLHIFATAGVSSSPRVWTKLIANKGRDLSATRFVSFYLVMSDDEEDEFGRKGDEH
ncbi:hypothetical protein QN277_004310 [Acacia crassicarpa]|uniref:Uncharacterized protein n=1 Tax=Acacia crassicarpa TaxID=499986 RepID=A0AAE1K151_9FABA|nr:hypothetical protein QN277_004310 [Acacia crassicarpa]